MGVAPGGAHGMAVVRTLACDTLLTCKGLCEPGLLEAAVDRGLALEATLSRTAGGSDVSRMNEARGEWVEISAHTERLLKAAVALSCATGGAFDVAVGPASALWDFREGATVPDGAALEEASRHVDAGLIEVHEGWARLLDPEARVDLGGIAKGYMVDELVGYLREGSCEQGIVDLGGNVSAFGEVPSGGAWSAGVADPLAAGSLAATIELTDGALATSGVTERAFRRDGQAYWHILDARTCRPASTDIASVSVAAPSAFLAECWSTPLLMMGAEAALAFAESKPLLECLIVMLSGERLQTSGGRSELF
ncbi:FAD:protein FMN transferase [Paratractidigestivibacter sp.]|uniref:FAD:protein FMN transferase n=1 Tax=Paratractidigestivibacter sp. TaxID=2847316 RepID=UPI002ACB1386|nr:FAD:protein FMN transferase [Paratractidigestivibacter sp.]